MNLLRTMGATRAQLLWRVRLPSALPQFFTGLKVGVTFAYVAAIFAEYVGAYAGPRLLHERRQPDTSTPTSCSGR